MCRSDTKRVSGTRNKDWGCFLSSRATENAAIIQDANNRTHHFTLIKTLNWDLECMHGTSDLLLITAWWQKLNTPNPSFSPRHIALKSISKSFKRQIHNPSQLVRIYAFMKNSGHNDRRKKKAAIAQNGIKCSTAHYKEKYRFDHIGRTMRWNIGRWSTSLPRLWHVW